MFESLDNRFDVMVSYLSVVEFQQGGLHSFHSGSYEQEGKKNEGAEEASRPDQLILLYCKATLTES